MDFELVKMICYYRSLIAIALLKIEDKASCFDRILEIKYLADDEVQTWQNLKKIYDNTGVITKADIVKVFGWNKLDDISIQKLIGSDVEDEIDIYISNYEKLFKRINLCKTMSEYRESILKCERMDVEDLIERLNDEVSIHTTLEDTLKNLKDIYEDEIDKSRISTCISDIDNLNASFRKGTVNTIMGYTGSYKTLYCTNVTYDAIKSGLNVCYVSLEISKAEMYYNFLSRYSNESVFDRKLCHTDMKFKELDDVDKHYLFETLVPSFEKELSHHVVILDENDFVTNNSSMFNELFRSAEQRLIEQTGKGVDLIIIDHLNLLKFSDGGMNDYSKVNHWMSYFRKNCKNFIRKHKQVCILVAVQCSREGYEKAKRNDGTYSLTGAAEGNEIERSSENVLAIYSDSNLKQEKLAKIQLIKGRNCGEMEKPVLISVDPKYYMVSNYNDESDDETEEDIDVFNIANKSREIDSNLSKMPKERLERLSQLNVHFKES